MTSLLIGRFQPLHEGHSSLVRKLIAEGRKVVIGLRDGPQSVSNPYTAAERQEMFVRMFGPNISTITIPEDGGLEVVRGRNVGWEVRTISLDAKTERISATATRAANPKIPGQTLWFFGLPAAGKTTLATRVVRDCAGFVLLDGDEVRHAVDNWDMGEHARLSHLSYMAFTCGQLNRCGINVAAAFVTPMEEHRDKIRKVLPQVKFIWLDCDRNTCVSRDPKGMWKKASQGELPDFTGLGGIWEDPSDITLRVPTNCISVDAAFGLIKEKLDLISNGKVTAPAGAAA